MIHIQSAAVMTELPAEYTTYKNVFNTEKVEILLTHKISDHAIDLNEKDFSYDSLYNLFNTELRVLQEVL